MVGALVACESALVTDAYVAQYPDLGGGPQALIQGTLVAEGRCLWVDGPSGRVLALWPAAAHHESEDGGLVVRQGDPVARAGTAIRAAGGVHNHADHYRFIVDDLIGAEIPADCQAEGYVLLYEADSTGS